MIQMYKENGQVFYKVQVFVKDKDRKQKQKFKKGIKSEEEAKALEAEFRYELLKAIDQRSCYTFGDWHEECLRKMRLSLSPGTVLQYDGRLRRWLPKEWQKRQLSSITGSDIHKVIYERVGDQVSSVSRRVIFMLIRRIFEMAVEEGVLNRNPAAGVRVVATPKEQKVLTADEIAILLREAQMNAHEHYPLWAFAVMSGMRSGEMYALRWSDIDLDAGTIRISKQWTNQSGLTAPKNRKTTRIAPISAAFKRFLIELRQTFPNVTKELYDSRAREMTAHDDYVLPQLRDWTNGMQADVLRRFCREVGITEVKFHDLRASFITNLLTNGVPLVKVMSIVGHSKMSTTDVYVRLAGVNVKDATENLGYQPPEALSGESNVVRLRPRG